jgi:hypothetical protein
VLRTGGGRRLYDSRGHCDTEIADLEDYLIALQDELTGVKVRLGQLRTEQKLDRKR